MSAVSACAQPGQARGRAMRHVGRGLVPRRARQRLALLASLALLAPLAPRAESAEAVGALLRQAAADLGDEELGAARENVERLLAAHGDDPRVRLLGGVLRFHEQRYGEAVELLEASGTTRFGGIDYLAVARAAREVTKGHVRASSEHFTVSTPPGKDEVLVPYLLETLEAQRRALEGDLGRVPPGKVTVEVLNGVRELARISTLTEEEIRTSGTIALQKFNKLMIVSPKALVKGYDWLDTAAHEYTHYAITQRTRNNTPIWLHEGLAKWAETRWRGAGGTSLSPYAAALLRDAARKNKLVTFEQMHPSMAKLPSQEAASLAFAEVMVAVEWLFQKGGAPLLSAILDRVGAETPVEKAFGEAGVPWTEFLAGWKRHMAARPLPPGSDAEERKLQFAEEGGGHGPHAEWAEIPDPRARQFARLGEILRERGRWRAARVEYGKAMGIVGARSPLLTSKWALAAAQSGREADAEGPLAEAVALHPHHAALHVALGRLKVRRQDWAGARAAFLMANRVDPFDPEIHAGLALAAEGTGDGATAERERGFARRLAGRGHRQHTP